MNIGENSTGLDLNSSHSKVNEVAKRLIFLCFPRYSIADALKNTLIAKIRHCGFVAGGDGRGKSARSHLPADSSCDEAFVSAHQQSQRSNAFKDTPRKHHRTVTLSLAQYQTRYCDRDEAMARAYLSTAFTMSHIAAAFHISSKTVSRAVSAFNKAQLAAD